MGHPQESAWRALARSSPWLWRTVEFELSLSAPPQPGHRPPVLHAWLRKPGDVRVEEDGILVAAAQDQARGPQPQDGPVTFREDGLVATRAELFETDDHGLYHQNYYWLAMLDPRELADGQDWERADSAETPRQVPGTTLTDLAVTDRFGRETWWAMVGTTADYQPRCSCCALLPGEVADLLEFGDGAPPARERGWQLTTTWLVGLDRETGLAVSIENVDGSAHGHSMRILAVDEPMANSLFC